MDCLIVIIKAAVFTNGLRYFYLGVPQTPQNWDVGCNGVPHFVQNAPVGGDGGVVAE